MKTFLGIDIGGTNTKAGIVDEDGKVLEFAENDMPQSGGPEAEIAVIAQIIEFLENIKPSDTKLKIELPRLVRHNKIYEICRMPFTTITIHGNGLVSACCALNPKKEIGNVIYDKNVWNSPYIRKIREVHLNKLEPLPEYCKNCDYMYKFYKTLRGKSIC